MAKILNKDPVTYEKERENFLKELRHFHETRGTLFKKTPKINGKDIDLYLLYVVVTAHGGWIKKEGEEAQRKRKRKREDRKSREREWEIEKQQEEEMVVGGGTKATPQQV
ncbi:AT-rich interactive domain-containing protein 2 [Cyphomyrmex costatus]|uniref:AT-rich interactive domain-containing protein 2 n=1 Tax=Cyphomyrmex costatus TaxID=456900 RepID=A0A195CRH2_9HYME|nr:AT-rich interactive domain-containing protein 2 [Cyphomyrmex costatus]